MNHLDNNWNEEEDDAISHLMVNLPKSPSKKQVNLTPFNFKPTKPNSKFLVRKETSKDFNVPTMVVYLNNLCNCEISIYSGISIDEIITSSIELFKLNTAKKNLYTLSLWIEHKSHQEIINPFQSYEENKDSTNVKFHLHRKRLPEKKATYVPLGPDFSSLLMLKLEGDISGEKVNLLISDSSDKNMEEKPVTILSLLTTTRKTTMITLPGNNNTINKKNVVTPKDNNSSNNMKLISSGSSVTPSLTKRQSTKKYKFIGSKKNKKDKKDKKDKEKTKKNKTEKLKNSDKKDKKDSKPLSTEINKEQILTLQESIQDSKDTEEKSFMLDEIVLNHSNNTTGKGFSLIVKPTPQTKTDDLLLLNTDLIKETTTQSPQTHRRTLTKAQTLRLGKEKKRKESNFFSSESSTSPKKNEHM